MLHGILLISFIMGFPHAAAQARRKQPSLLFYLRPGLPWLVKLVTLWLMLWSSHELSADRDVSGDFDQAGLCNPAKASSSICLQINVVQ